MKPKVYLIGRSHFYPYEFISFLKDQNFDWKRTSGATELEELVEVAGRICYMSFGNSQSTKSTAKYIQNLINIGHESVLEHVSWTFLITNISRSLTHQLVRHRVGFSFSQVSQQYYDHRNAKFIRPALIEKDPKAREIWEKTAEMTRKSYADILKILNEHKTEMDNNLKLTELYRAIRSAARSVLPNATEAKIVVTGNARSFRHFLKIRGSILGDEEMRRVAHEIFKYLQRDAPSLFCDFLINLLPDGSPVVLHKKSAT